MKYHIHIPKLLEFALNVVCDDVTLRGKQCLITSIPYPLYLRCIITYADKYDKTRYSTYRWYQDVVHGRDDRVYQIIPKLYPNVLDHIVLDDSVEIELISNVARSHLIDDTINAIHRFASRCMSSDKLDLLMMVMNASLACCANRSIRDVVIHYGGVINPNDQNYFARVCSHGMNEMVAQAVRDGRDVHSTDLLIAVESGDCETIRIIHTAYDGDCFIDEASMYKATYESMELLSTLNLIERGKHSYLHNIPSFAVLQWILDHDVMSHDDIVIDVAKNAAHYSDHHVDMLHWLIEQQHLTVPKNVLTRMDVICDLLVIDYLLVHGADIDAFEQRQSLQGPYVVTIMTVNLLLVRHYIDSGISKSTLEGNDGCLSSCICRGMTAPVLEMMIDKYSLDINKSHHGDTPLHTAIRCNNYDVVVVLCRHGADVENLVYDGTIDDRIQELLKKERRKYEHKDICIIM